MIMCIIIFSCNNARKSKLLETDVAKLRIGYDSLATQMINSLAYIQKPLNDLNKEQKASVAALLIITRIATQQQFFGEITKTDLISKVWEQMPDLCPEKPEVILNRFGDYRDQLMAYGVAMAKCLEDESKSESDCEKECWVEASECVEASMKELEELPGIIDIIPGRDWPPEPFPWLIMNNRP